MEVPVTETWWGQFMGRERIVESIPLSLKLKRQTFQRDGKGINNSS